MKGYFSRIAKQSGVRYLAQGRETSGAAAILPDSPFSPIEREETVMAPSSFPKASAERQNTSGTKAVENVPQSPVPQKDRIDENAQPVPEKTRHSKAERALVSEEATETVLREPQMVTQRSENSTGQTGNENDPPTGRLVRELPAVEQIVFVKSGKPERPFVRPTESASAESRPIESAEPGKLNASEFVPPPEPEKREYFTKTAEIIGKVETSERDPAVIQNIVFQEVQEWVAASVNTTTPDPGDAKPPEAVLIREFDQRKEPGVVTIREDARPEPSERSQLAEQSFELSIGTISVVIEEPEKSKQPEPSPQRTKDQNRGGETKREYARLSKHYI